MHFPLHRTHTLADFMAVLYWPVGGKVMQIQSLSISGQSLSKKTVASNNLPFSPLCRSHTSANVMAVLQWPIRGKVILVQIVANHSQRTAWSDHVPFCHNKTSANVMAVLPWPIRGKSYWFKFCPLVANHSQRTAAGDYCLFSASLRWPTQKEKSYGGSNAFKDWRGVINLFSLRKED